MKKSKKSTFFVVAIIILAFTYMTLFGVSTYYGDIKKIYVKGANDIRWGIDIQGGVEAVFMPDMKDLSAISDLDMDNAEQIIKLRLTNNNITDAEVYTDRINKQVIVRFPWQENKHDFDPAKAVEELGATAMLKFCEGTEDQSKVILTGSDVNYAEAVYYTNESNTRTFSVKLKLKSEGKAKFSEATKRLQNQYITIWLDENVISSATVNEHISEGEAFITGNFDGESANDLANTINAGSLPFALSVDQSKLSIISPSLGRQSLDVMLMAGIIAFALIIILMVVLYRLPGIVAVFSITAQIATIFAFTSGFFTSIPSFTLTVPGIAGIILSIGMGVDANVINSERIKEEIRSGKTIDGSIKLGYERGFSAILDGNVTVMIVAIILMGAFGPPTTIFSKVISPLMFMFSSSITGSIYSFGFTLLIGTIANMFIGVFLSELMLKSLAQFKALRKPSLYGGVK